MDFDYSKLRGRIRETFGTEANFAKSLGISSVSLSSKLNNDGYFRQSEIIKSCDLLGLELESLPAYFFKKIVKST